MSLQIWLGGTVAAIFVPVWVVGTDPEQIPIGALMIAIAEIVLTGIVCSIVKATSFQPAESQVGFPTASSTEDRESLPGGLTLKLRELTQLRDSGAITEGEFQAKRTGLLNRV